MIETLKQKINQILTNREYKTLVIYILLGVLVRLLLMPSAVHDDMLSATWREYSYIYNGQFNVSDLMEATMSFYMKLIKPLLTDLPSLLNRADANLATSTVSYVDFVSNRHALRDLFLLKIPYLLFDFATLVVILKTLKERSSRFIGVVFWAFNPLNLFASYMWGRFEVMPMFFTFLAFFFAYKKNTWPALFALSLAISTRTSYILFLPFFVIYFAKNWKDAILFTIASLIPPFITSHVIGYLGGGSVSDTLQSGFLDFTIRGQVGNEFTATALNVILYPLVLYLFYLGKKKSFKRLVSFSTIGIAAYFAFSYFHPQYLTWLTPCLLLATTMNKRIIWPVVGLNLSYLAVIDLYFGYSRTTGLFSPLDPNLFATLGGLSNQSFLVGWQGETLLVIAHSLFVLMIGIISLILYKDAQVEVE